METYVTKTLCGDLIYLEFTFVNKARHLNLNIDECNTFPNETTRIEADCLLIPNYGKNPNQFQA